MRGDRGRRSHEYTASGTVTSRGNCGVLDVPAQVEDEWEHVAQIGLNAPGGRLQVFSWTYGR